MEFISINSRSIPQIVIHNEMQMTLQEAQSLVSSELNIIGAYGYHEGPMFIGSYVFVDVNGTTYRPKLLITVCERTSNPIKFRMGFIEIKIKERYAFSLLTNPFRGFVTINQQQPA